MTRKLRNQKNSINNYNISTMISIESLLRESMITIITKIRHSPVIKIGTLTTNKNTMIKNTINRTKGEATIKSISKKEKTIKRVVGRDEFTTIGKAAINTATEIMNLHHNVTL